MCGYITIAGPNPEKFLLEKGIKELKHRGPDDEGFVKLNNVHMAHVRLSVLDLSSNGKQPMSLNDKNLYIAYNGEIYNYLELKSDLSDASFFSKTDTEVILYYFQKYKEKCLEKFNGMFSFSIWDESKKQLFAARDRLGIKPLYYCQIDNHLLISSEIKGLIPFIEKIEPNQQMIWDYLVMGFSEHNSETFFNGIKKLAPGHFMTYTMDGKLKIQPYWNLEDSIKITNKNEVQDVFFDLLQQVIEWECRSDIPIGILFSGGLDSSILLHLMNQKLGGQIEAFSYNFYGKYDQSEFMRNVIKDLDIKHHISTLSPKEFLDDFSNTMWFQEEPTGSITMTAFKNVFQHIVDRNVGVVLSGNGMDEIASGYLPYFYAHLADIKDSEDQYNKTLRDFCKNHNLDKSEVNNIVSNYDLKNELNFSVTDRTTQLNSSSIRSSFIKKYQNEIDIKMPFDSNLSNLRYRDLFHLKVPRSLRYQDRMSMRFGKELRPPFLNHLLVELSYSIPHEYFFKGGKSKGFLRNIINSRMPEINFDETKRYMIHPQREWLQHDLKKEVLDMIHSESFQSREFIDGEKAIKDYEAWARGEANNSYFIWQWINLETWFRVFID